MSIFSPDWFFNYYRVLDVGQNAGASDIKRAFLLARARQLKWWQLPFKRCHAQLVESAYLTLSDKRLRAQHDRMLAFRRMSHPQPPV